MGPAGPMQGKVARRSGRPGLRLVFGRARADLRDESRLGLGGSGPVREESRRGLPRKPGQVREEIRPGLLRKPGPVREEIRPGPLRKPGPGLLSEPGPFRDESRPGLNEPEFDLGVGLGRLGLGAGWVGRADPVVGPGWPGGRGQGFPSPEGHLPGGISPGGPAIRATGSRCSPGRRAHRDMRSFPTARRPGNGRLRWNPRTSWTRRFRRPQRRRRPRRRPYPQRPHPQRPHPQRPANPQPANPQPANPLSADPPPANPQSANPPPAYPQQAPYPRQPSRSRPPQPLRRSHRHGLGPTRFFRPLFRPPRPVLLPSEHAAHRGRGRPR